MREIPIDQLDIPARSTLEKAQRAMLEGYFHYARGLLFSLLRHYPNCAPLRMMIRQNTVALNNRPIPSIFATLATFFLSLFFYFKKSPLTHLNTLEWILLYTPDNLYTHRQFYQLALKKDMIAAAILSLETINTLSPHSSHQQIELSRAYLRQGRVEEAQAIIRAVIERTPHDVEAEEVLKQASIQQTLGQKTWK